MLSEGIIPLFFKMVFTVIEYCRLCSIDRYYFNLSVEVRVCVCQAFGTARTIRIGRIVNDSGRILVCGFIVFVIHQVAAGHRLYTRRIGRSECIPVEPTVACKHIDD